jgi:hypothetical protein
MPTIDSVSSISSSYGSQRISRPVSGREGTEATGAPAGDQAVFSPEARQKAKEAAVKDTQAEKDAGGLDEDQKKEVDQLKQRDQEVRSHEQAHMMAGGSLVRGGASYSYRTGPDGKRYAVGGEVSIDTSPVDGDPRATIRKAQQIRKAAQAPAEPSGQDQAVAAEAASMEMKAQRELSTQNTSGGKTRQVNRTA